MSAEGLAPVSFELKIDAGDNPDHRWLQDVTHGLKQELSVRTDTTVEVATGEAGEDTKALGGLELGALAIQVIPSAVTGLLDCLSSWLQSRGGRVIKIELKRGNESVYLEFDKTTTGDVEALVSRLLGK